MLVRITHRRNGTWLVTSPGLHSCIAPGNVTGKEEAWPRPGDELMCVVCRTFMQQLLGAEVLRSIKPLESRLVELTGRINESE